MQPRVVITAINECRSNGTSAKWIRHANSSQLLRSTFVASIITGVNETLRNRIQHFRRYQLHALSTRNCNMPTQMIAKVDKECPAVTRENRRGN